MKYSGINSRFQDEEKKRKISKREQFNELINDHEDNQSLMGRRPSEYDEGLALDYHEDSYHPHDISRVHPDDEIRAVIRELLQNSNRIDASDILVGVDHSNVSLSGRVKSQRERDYALSIVKLVHGVGEIHSELTVDLGPHKTLNDERKNPSP